MVNVFAPAVAVTDAQYDRRALAQGVDLALVDAVGDLVQRRCRAPCEGAHSRPRSRFALSWWASGW